ncbi:MAG: porin, partial [Burkholderiaceae bacterium]
NIVQNSGALNGSRWGLRGSEDLGGGLKANFTLESGINLDTGAAAQNGVTFSRQAFAGLSGAFGEVRLGRQYSAYDEVRGAFNNTSDSGTFAATGGGTSGGVFGAGGDYTNRIDNQVYYATPNFAGFTASVGYGLGENKTATLSAGKILSAKLQFAAGPFAVAYAHQTEDAQGPTPVSSKYNLLAGSFDLKVVKVVGYYNKASGPDKENEYQVGVQAPLGAVTVFAGYANSKAKTNAGATTDKGRAYSLLATYDLSKRSAVYAGLIDLERKNPAGVKTVDHQTIGLGLRHRF